MNPKKMMTLRLGLALLMAGTVLGGAAQAQTGSPAVTGERPGDALTRHLRTIADQPRNVSALTGAGRAALELGDPQAALTFFARAEEIAPRDGRIKAGMGAAFVQMEQVHAALKFFEDAAGLGVPEGEFAGDRGLAHDLNGEPRRAQADYNLALKRQENPEVRRRLALSHAISGERDKALAAIDGQLRAQDRAAWRVRTFILALTGDAAEATRSAEAVMPGQAAQMRPFFAALPALRPAERAMAVHFGHFPNDGTALAAASAGQYASAAPALNSAGPTAIPQATLPRRNARGGTSSNASRRRPASEERSAAPTEARRNAISERLAWSGRGGSIRRKPEAERPVAVANARESDRGANAAAQATPSSASPPQQVAAPVPTGPVQQMAQQPQRQQPLAQPQSSPPAPSQPVATSQLRQPLPQTAPSGPLQRQPQPVTTVGLLASAPPAQQPVAQSRVPSAPTASGQSSTSAAGFSLSPSQSSSAPTAPTPSVRLAELAPSLVSPEAGQAPTPERPAVAEGADPQQPVAGTGLAGIAAAIESLPPEEASAPVRTKEPEPTRLASNTVAKRSYGPKFETQPKPSYGPRFETSSKAATDKPASAKPIEPASRSADAEKNEPKENAAKAEPAKKPASAKKNRDEKAAAKDEPAKKLALAKKADKKPAAEKEEPAKKEPSRHWVQIAGGANEAALSREFLRIKAKAPKLFASRTPWKTPLRATNRLLVGPFKTADEAQDFVNELAKLDLPAFSWTSPAGQEIVKLAAK